VSAEPGPLAGVRVIDLSTVLAGPYCAMLLADLGADVVKVEPPGGDPTRLYGPPYAGAPAAGVTYPADDPRASPGYPGESGYYLSVNRNKRGIGLDLRTDGGREVLRRLLARSDVLIENQRPGGLERLGFGDAVLETLNPRLVHLAISGYGTSGPAHDRPGFDFIIQAVSGLMSITGQPDEEGGQPTKVGVAITDLTTGMLGAVAVLAALHARDAAAMGVLPAGRAAGRGQRIDVSLLGSTIAWLANQAANLLVGGEIPGRMGNRHPNITPYETYRTADGEVAVAVGSERQWRRFCAALDLPGLAEDPRFRTNVERVHHRDELAAILASRFADEPSSAWVERLSAADVPVGQVRDLAAVFADPLVRELGMLASIGHPTIGQLWLTGTPWRLSGTPASIRRPPPLLGEHGEEILRELGYDAPGIEALRRSGAVEGR
jgi:crotonobetainyl-CoA:carnitine CoA-transferase CaiB-like acyl-CoA transferase